VLRYQAQFGRIEQPQVVLVKPNVVHYGTLIDDILRGVGEPIATFVHQCQEICAGRAAPRLNYEGNDVELRSLVLAVNDLLKYFNGFVAGFPSTRQ
jgi:hypothetical protein